MSISVIGSQIALRLNLDGIIILKTSNKKSKGKVSVTRLGRPNRPAHISVSVA